MTELTDWYGKLSGQRTDACALQMQAVLNAESEDRGGSRPCHVAADDGQTYWIKQVNNPQSARVPVTEQVIAACGLLIGAPVRETRLIGIPADFEGEKLMNGTVLGQGIAHGSLNLEFAIFDKTWAPDHRDRDDNRRRHAAYFALFDWCWGDDRQWLYDSAEDLTMYSHDHGHFLPGAPDWSGETLRQAVDLERSLDTSPDGLDRHELIRVANALEAMTTGPLLRILASIPASWPVDDQELEVLGWFLDCRRGPVAGRIRQLAARLA